MILVVSAVLKVENVTWLIFVKNKVSPQVQMVGLLPAVYFLCVLRSFEKP